MNPIFDSQGLTVSWLRGEYVHDLSGNAVAFIKGGAVYLYSGQQIGWLMNGFFRDGYGNAVAFMRGCTGGPLPPLAELPPLAPLAALAPLRPLTSLPSLPPTPSLSWSNLSWEQFLG